jgi:hypothetical protein
MLSKEPNMKPCQCGKLPKYQLFNSMHFYACKQNDHTVSVSAKTKFGAWNKWNKLPHKSAGHK